MKITGFGTVDNTKNTKKTQKKGGIRSFADVLDTAEASDVDDAAPASKVRSTSSVGGLLGIQEVQEDAHREKTLQRGHEMLDTLDDLRRQLLLRGPELAMLQKIERQIKENKQQPMDESMRAVMDGIEIRAAVELAKLEKARDDEDNN